MKGMQFPDSLPAFAPRAFQAVGGLPQRCPCVPLLHTVAHEISVQLGPRPPREGAICGVAPEPHLLQHMPSHWARCRRRRDCAPHNGGAGLAL
eukprot:CAMPEP_0117576110 /NCGR_PEP_ID=MMETSP0784-20121206/62608_1 /TAXON_ID=39447 /ORGANISM="" /LENGTH=92 /DNA_ID=CAMNT_0005375311 /DNA_START=109 /DNA_END=388 /DNA_ORIENTATION=+